MSESSLTTQVFEVWQRLNNVKSSANLKALSKFGKTLLKTIKNAEEPNLVPCGAPQEIEVEPDESLLGSTTHCSWQDKKLATTHKTKSLIPKPLALSITVWWSKLPKALLISAKTVIESI